jgi:4-amino-4-deoxy-L-arabinose transferase-like glycosyltransferase
MERHLIVARIHRGLAWFYGLLTLLFIFATVMSEHEISPLASLYFMIIFGGMFALHFFTSRGASHTKNWARKTSIGIALLMLLGFPIGTVIGVYLLMNTTGGWADEVASPATVVQDEDISETL